jgi:ketosteroid isomerase-like protein
MKIEELSDRARLADAFVGALAVPDVDALRSLVDPDARFWVNIGPADYSAADRFRLLDVERSHLRALTFEEVRVSPTTAGFVVQLTTVATTTASVELRIPVCLVVTVADGIIVRVEEYADSAPAAPLIDAMLGGS